MIGGHMARGKWKDLTIADDLMFGAVMSIEENCRDLIETVLDIKVRHLEFVNRQRTIDLLPDSKGIRLDLFAIDSDGIAYDIEIQRANQGNLSKRARYYQSLIDLELLEPGLDYASLNRSYVIFVCMFDPFGLGRACYTFQETCVEDTSLSLGDGTTKVFLNAFGAVYTANPRLSAFLSYLTGDTSCKDDFVRRIDAEVRRLNQSPEWRREIVDIRLKLQDIRYEGWLEGRDQGLAEGREQEARELTALFDKLDASGRLAEYRQALDDAEKRNALMREFALDSA